MNVTIWHNPRCSKSRQTLQLLRDNGVEPDVRLYLEATPTTDELKIVLGKLGKTPRELLRRTEAEYKTLGLAAAGDQQVLAAMSQHPRLIERPVVIRGDAARLGRPPEDVLGLFD